MTREERQHPTGEHVSDMLKAICSAGDRCSCADKNYQWRDQSCDIAIAHVNAISLRLFGTIGRTALKDTSNADR